MPNFRRALGLALLLLLSLLSTAARAAPRLVAEPSQLSLPPLGGTRWVTLKNLGDEPLHLFGVSVSADSAGFDVPSAPAAGTTLAPGQSLSFEVRYTGSGPRRQALGALLVFCDDPRGGDDPRTDERDHVLGVALTAGEVLWPLALWAVPLSAGLAIALLRRVRESQRLHLHLARAAGLATLLLGGLLLARFDPGFGVHNGNYGAQLVTHRALGLGLAWFAGYDGLSVTLSLAALLAGVVLVWQARTATAAAAQLVLLGATLGFLSALDARVAVLFWELALLALYQVLRDAAPATLARRWLLTTQLGTALVVTALALLHAHSLATPLVDGTMAPHSWDLIKLSYHNYYGDFRVLGRPLGHLAWPALTVGLLLPAALLIGPRLGARARLLGLGPAVLLGGYGVLRLPCGLLPDATVWAAPSIALCGALWTGLGLVRTRRAPELFTLLSLGLLARAGLLLLAVGSGTQSALLGGILTVGQLALLSALLAGLADVPAERRGLRFRGLLLLAALAALDAPGLLGGTARLLLVLGSFPVHRALTLGIAAALLAAPVWALAAWRRARPQRPAASADLSLLAAAGLGVLAVAQLALGVYPEAALGLCRTFVNDLITHGPGHLGASSLALLWR